MILNYEEVKARVTTKTMMYEVLPCKNQSKYSYKAFDVLINALYRGYSKRVTVLYVNGQLQCIGSGLGHAPKEIINDLYKLFNS